MYNLEQTLQDSTTTVGHGYCGEAHSEQTYESRLTYRCSSLGLTDTALSEHDSNPKSSLYTSRNVSTLTLSPVRNKRISTLTYRSLYDIQEPGYDDEERQQSQSQQEDIEQLWFRAPSSLSSGSDSGSGSGSASVALVTPAESIHLASRFSPVEYQYQKPKRGFFGRKQSDQGEDRRPSTFVSKLRTVLLSTSKPASSDHTGKPKKAAPFARLHRRRIQRSSPPQVDARSSSLYPHQTGSISVGGGPYDNLAAYDTGVASNQYASCLSFSDENRFSRHHHSFNAFASVADFRHYSTADLPLDPSVPYSPYHAASTYLAPSAVLAGFDKRPSEKEEEVFGSKPDLSLKTDKVRLREKTSTSNWADRSKQFWSSAIDLTLPRSYKKDKAMSTLDLAPISDPSTAPPPIPARSRLRPGPAINALPTNGSIVSLHQATPSLLPALPASPSGSSIGSSASGSRNGTASLSAASPGGPITPQTPFNPLPRDSDRDGTVDDGNGGKLRNITPPASSRAFGEYVVNGTGDSWPGKLDTGKTGVASPLPSSHSQQQAGKRSRFSRSRHSSSGSVSLSANNDPNRVRDGLAARSSQSGVYTPPSFPGPSPLLPQPPNSAPIHSTYPSPPSAAAPGPSRTLSASSFATTASSYLGSFKTSRSPTSTSPTMTTSPASPSAAANRMYSACVGAFSGLSVNMSNMMSGSATASTAKRSSVPTSETTPSHPYSPSGSGSRSASASYFTIPPRSTSYGSSSIGDNHSPSRGTSAGMQPRSVSDGSGNVQIWSPTEGWTAAGLGLGMDNGTHGTATQGRSRSNTGSVGVTIGDVPRGKRKPVPKVADSAQAKTEEEQFHAL